MGFFAGMRCGIPPLRLRSGQALSQSARKDGGQPPRVGSPVPLLVPTLTNVAIHRPAAFEASPT